MTKPWKLFWTGCVGFITTGILAQVGLGDVATGVFLAALATILAAVVVST